MNPSTWKQTKEALATAMELQGGARDEFISTLPDELRADVTRLLAADDNADRFIQEPILVERGVVSDDPEKEVVDGEIIDGYRLIRKVGSGGMGAVYLAEQSGEGFSQKVALKLIKRGMDTGAVLKRFLMERQILANLEHPNIARMLDGGSTVEGLPYFVMEYVDGQEIREYCKGRKLGLVQRLKLFRKICDAVANAHQKLVVHRDLKPSNILVTNDGEPKLLDFGIAKLTSPDWNADTNEATITQFRIMTPEYASPEQLAGEATATSTDIYSLGVILYELLTGERPHLTRGKTPREIADSVLSSDPPKPSTVWLERSIKTNDTNDHELAATSNDIDGHTRQTSGIVEPRLLQGDLDNIILKAMRREPERRYQSVQEFSEDIRRYLDGLPVNATADSRLYRFNKYFKRHRVGVIATTAALLLLLAATGITAWQYTVAQRERAAAEKRFAETRILAKSMLYDLHDKIEQIPGSTSAREFLIESALTYIDSLAAEKIDDPDLQSELSDAYQRIGDIQGGLWRANLGQREKAEANYAKATAILESLVQKYPERFKLRWKLSQLYAATADAAYQKTDFVEYASFAEKALEQAVPIETNFETDSYYEYYIVDLIASYHRVARAKALNADLDGAYQLGTKAREIAQAAKVRLPESYPVRSAAGVVEESMADLLVSLKRHEEALAIYYSSLQAQQSQNDVSSGNATANRNLMVTFSAIAKIEAFLGRYQDALSNIERAIEISNKTLAADPQNADGQLISANFRSSKGAILQSAGRNVEAIAALIPVLADWQKLRQADPENQIIRYMETDSQGAIGKAHLAIGLQSKRRADLLLAREMLQKAYATNKEFRDAGISSGDEAAETDVLAEKLKECEAALGL